MHNKFNIEIPFYQVAKRKKQEFYAELRRLLCLELL